MDSIGRRDSSGALHDRRSGGTAPTLTGSGRYPRQLIESTAEGAAVVDPACRVGRQGMPLEMDQPAIADLAER